MAGSDEGPNSGGATEPHPHDRRIFVVVGAVLAVVLLALAVATFAQDDDGSSVASGRGTSTTAAPPTQGSAPTDAAPGTSAVGASTTTGPKATTTTKPPKGSKGPKSGAISLVFAGDLLPHGPVNAEAARYGRQSGKPYDYDPMLAPMKPIVSGADVAICHMEVPIAPPGQAVSSYPSFGSPPELADAARATGYDGCSNGSNHALDRGRAGIQATLDRFDQDGLKHAGTARTQDEANTITTYDVQGVRVAHLSYAYGFNGYAIPADAPWSVKQIDVPMIEADAARAKAEGADLVVVSLHWGTEYHAEPDQYQRDVAAQLLPSTDIDVIIGAHAHVVQPIQQVEGTFVVWGMGNQLSNQSQASRRDGLTVRVTATRQDGRWKVSGVEGIPTWVEPGSFRVLPVVDTLKDPATPAGLRAELSASYDRTAAVLDTPANPGVALAPKP
ncbi:CapA family protein [Aquihabitans sp. G128]|uniref:CapA family protein n=1 Tax=Aquihabitans sp. G128 TaxID=2849779 RepID=UPI001C24C2C1|nr:CapA family protein [Aquihabitans sp. G128]QXC59253.1 CapA family protein [Aquihabitans sp. G128]